MKSHLIFLGSPGSGKGTQANLLAKKIGFEKISTGVLLREEIEKKTDLGKEIKYISEKGGLVDDHIVLKLIKSQTNLENKSYIFDGFPRNLRQSKLFDKHIILKDTFKAIYFKVDSEKMIQRIVNRRVADESGEIYNLISKPPLVPGKCDISGENLIQRKDDYEEIVRNRLQLFKDLIDPVLAYYDKCDQLQTIDANRTVDEIFSNLKSLLI